MRVSDEKTAKKSGVREGFTKMIDYIEPGESRSCMYGVFSNIFYTGKMRYCGELYDGEHEPMVSKAEFEKVQQILRPDVSTTRHKKYDFALRGPLYYGECGYMITAENKYKNLKKTGV